MTFSLESKPGTRDVERLTWTVETDAMSPEEWNGELRHFADATVYQTWAYGKISWGESQLSHLVVRREGIVVGMAQVRIVALPIIGRGVAYVRYGPLWRRKNESADPEILNFVSKAVRDEYGGRRKLLVRILANTFRQDPFSPMVDNCWTALGFIPSPDARVYRTLRVDIAVDLVEIRKRFDGKWRNQLNRAEKNGLTIVEGTSKAEYAVFQTLYDEMYARKGFDTTVDTHEFQKIQEELPPPQKMLILLAYKDATPISALIASGIGETGIYLLGATSNEGMQHKGSYLLQWRMIERLKEKGCLFYDLGGINPEANPGVYHFKCGFSGADVSFISQYEFSGSWLSSFSVQAGKRFRGAKLQLRSLIEKRSSAVSVPETSIEGKS